MKQLIVTKSIDGSVTVITLEDGAVTGVHENVTIDQDALLDDLKTWFTK